MPSLASTMTYDSWDKSSTKLEWHGILPKNMERWNREEMIDLGGVTQDMINSLDAVSWDNPNMADQFVHDEQVRMDAQKMNTGSRAALAYRKDRSDGTISCLYVMVNVTFKLTQIKKKKKIFRLKSGKVNDVHSTGGKKKSGKQNKLTVNTEDTNDPPTLAATSSAKPKKKALLCCIGVSSKRSPSVGDFVRGDCHSPSGSDQEANSDSTDRQDARPASSHHGLPGTVSASGVKLEPTNSASQTQNGAPACNGQSECTTSAASGEQDAPAPQTKYDPEPSALPTPGQSNASEHPADSRRPTLSEQQASSTQSEAQNVSAGSCQPSNRPTTEPSDGSEADGCRNEDMNEDILQLIEEVFRENGFQT